MRQLEIKYTFLKDGLPQAAIKAVTSSEAVASLSKLLEQPNRYNVKFNGLNVTKVKETGDIVTLYFENDSWGMERLPLVVKSTYRLEEVIGELRVTQLIKPLDGGLASHYPISVEAWL